MKKITTILLLATVFLANVSFAQSVTEMIPKVMAPMGNAKTMTYHFYAQERMHDGKYSKSDVEFKVIASPLKIYAKAKLPQSAQLIYDDAVSKDVRVKKGFKLRKLADDVSNNPLLKNTAAHRKSHRKSKIT